jgi:Tol biopolymer transport system component
MSFPTPQILRHWRSLLIVAAPLVLASCGATTTSGLPGIYVVPSTGGETQRVAPAPARPAWSPGGSEIAWAAEDGLWVASPTGDEAVQLLDQRDLAPPAWSPDGSELALVDPTSHRLLIVGASGENPDGVQIGEQEFLGGDAPVLLRNVPSWSPDGQNILVSAWDGHGDTIFLVDRPGLTARPITRIRTTDIPFVRGDPDSPMRARANAAFPTWSPDGELFAFGAIPQVARAQGGVYAGPPGEETERVTALVPLFGPLWSPDGERLLIIAAADARRQLIEIDVSTGDATALDLPADLEPRDAAWSPDGSRIAFSADGAIHLYDRGSGAVSVLADTPLDDLTPAFSPDGRQIAFRSELDRFPQPSLPPVP